MMDRWIVLGVMWRINFVRFIRLIRVISFVKFIRFITDVNLLGNGRLTWLIMQLKRQVRAVEALFVIKYLNLIIFK